MCLLLKHKLECRDSDVLPVKTLVGKGHNSPIIFPAISKIVLYLFFAMLYPSVNFDMQLMHQFKSY